MKRPPSLMIPLAVCGLFCGVVFGCHQFAIFRSAAVRSPILEDARLEKCLRLVDSIHSHWPWGLAYGIMICGAVAFSILRRHPRWSTWLLFLVLSWPWFYYIYACAYVAGNAAAA